MGKNIFPFLYIFLLVAKCEENPADERITRYREEQSLIAKTSGRVWRDGDRLYIRAENGKEHVYVNQHLCGQSEDIEYDYSRCINYEFVSYQPAQHGIVIYEGYPEEGGFQWVDERTGDIEALEAVPEFSPSGRFFIMMDPWVFEEPSISIYNYTDGKMLKEQDTIILLDYVIYSARWIDDDNICIAARADLDEDMETELTKQKRRYGGLPASLSATPTSPTEQLNQIINNRQKGQIKPYENVPIHIVKREGAWVVEPYFPSQSYCMPLFL